MFTGGPPCMLRTCEPRFSVEQLKFRSAPCAAKGSCTSTAVLGRRAEGLHACARPFCKVIVLAHNLACNVWV